MQCKTCCSPRLNRLGVKAWTHVAAESGITDTTTFVRCVNERITDTIGARVSLAAMKLGVTSTPPS